MMDTMTPKMPKADPKISTIRILTNKDAFWASARAQPEPATPTQILQAPTHTSHTRSDERTRKKNAP